MTKTLVKIINTKYHVLYVIMRIIFNVVKYPKIHIEILHSHNGCVVNAQTIFHLMILCDKDFINTIKCCNHNYHRVLIINPFDDSDISYNLPMDEIDPDQYYYNSLLQNKCNSNYFDDSEFNQMFSDKYCNISEFISMYHINIRSIVKNQDELLIHLHRPPPFIVSNVALMLSLSLRIG